MLDPSVKYSKDRLEAERKKFKLFDENLIKTQDPEDVPTILALTVQPEIQKNCMGEVMRSYSLLFNTKFYRYQGLFLCKFAMTFPNFSLSISKFY